METLKVVWVHFKDVSPYAAAVLIIGTVFILFRKSHVHSLEFGKNGFLLRGKEKALEFSNLTDTLHSLIIDHDGKMIDFVILQSDKLRRKLLHFLDNYVKYPFVKRSVSIAIRHPLYNAARRNKFSTVLKPQNIQKYVDGLLEEIKLEYADVNAEHVNFICPVHNGKCVELPPWKEFEQPIKELLLKEWAYPIKDYRIKISRQKIETYEEYKVIYKDFGNAFMAEKAQQKIEKNRKYIDDLKNRGEIQRN
ncbi:MAG: hypothetical protein LBH43_18055 [Treponema sp.]|jgi:hypothetical protein|nr:hypothetical protein [Treponema sp.]